MEMHAPVAGSLMARFMPIIANTTAMKRLENTNSHGSIL
jgi:hypothetical protein